MPARDDGEALALHSDQQGAGVPILLIHPAGATGSTWGSVVDDLARVGRVITYDRRGYARSGGEPVQSIARHTQDAAALLGDLGLSAAVVVGTSVGATIGLDLARLRPDLVRVVVSHESPWHVTRQPPTPRQFAAITKMGWLSFRRRYPEAAAAFLRFAYTNRDGESAWDRFPEEWRRVVRENAEPALADIRMAIGRYPSAKELAAVTTPVVCTCGSRSPTTMRRVTQRLAAVIPTASFREINGAGHAAPFDAPTAFSTVIADAVASSALTHGE
jgi:pimeloyl-ACP methyl ester carboxylesterase